STHRGAVRSTRRRRHASRGIASRACRDDVVALSALASSSRRWGKKPCAGVSVPRPTELRARSTRKGGEATSRGAMQTRTEVCAAWDAAEWDREERDRWQTGAGPEGEGGGRFRGTRVRSGAGPGGGPRCARPARGASASGQPGGEAPRMEGEERPKKGGAT